MVQENPRLFPFRERSREGKVMRKIVAVVVLAMGLSACTPAQIAIWMDWVDHQPGVRMCTAQNSRWPCRPNGDNEPDRPDGNRSVSYAFVA